MGQELMKSRYTDKSLMKAVDPNKEWCDRYELPWRLSAVLRQGWWMHFSLAMSAMPNPSRC